MYLSPRESILLKELVTSPSPLSLNHLMNLLKVSRRTVYRELEQVEETLASIGASLEKIAKLGYKLEANEEQIQQIKEALDFEEGLELSAFERQHAIILDLLFAQEPIKLETFLEKYLVSNTTFYADIKQLETRLSALPLTIERNMGYEIKGVESQKRLLIASVMDAEINEYQFFHFVELEEKDNYFLGYLKREQLLYAQGIISEKANQLQALSDRKLKFLILVLAITMTRVQSGHILQEENIGQVIKKELLDLSRQLFAKLSSYTRQLYNVSEIVFYASLLEDFTHLFDQSFFEENFKVDLVYRTKALIEFVSEESSVHFFEDEELHKFLLTHLSALLSRRTMKQDNVNNPILERILQQYQELALVVRKGMTEVFAEKEFPEEEIAYVLLHFANSFEKSPHTLMINLAAISPMGIASSRILEMRLRRYFPYVSQIDFYRVSQLAQKNLLDSYDMVISTSRLSGYQGKYKLVSPLLLDDEVKELKEEFKKLSYSKKTVEKQESAIELTNSFEDVSHLFAQINALLAAFAICELDNSSAVKEVLREIFERIDDKKVTDKEEIIESLIKRFNQAPIGIPNTTLSLFHTANAKIIEPLFLIFDLAHPLSILGMDKEEMQTSRILLMLAPSPMDEATSRLFGKISASIIMNDLNTEIYNSGNQAILSQFLQSILIEEVKN